jgi:dienelactone hydrolase
LDPGGALPGLEGASNVKVVVYPGVGHGFALPFGHHAQYDHNAAADAKTRAEAFLDARAIR